MTVASKIATVFLFVFFYYLLQALLQMCQTAIRNYKILKASREVSDTWRRFLFLGLIRRRACPQKKALASS
jgi:hypothetical protein